MSSVNSVLAIVPEQREIEVQENTSKMSKRLQVAEPISTLEFVAFCGCGASMLYSTFALMSLASYGGDYAENFIRGSDHSLSLNHSIDDLSLVLAAAGVAAGVALTTYGIDRYVVDRFRQQTNQDGSNTMPVRDSLKDVIGQASTVIIKRSPLFAMGATALLMIDKGIQAAYHSAREYLYNPAEVCYENFQNDWLRDAPHMPDEFKICHSVELCESSRAAFVHAAFSAAVLGGALVATAATAKAVNKYGPGVCNRVKNLFTKQPAAN